jgi:hypothetical protein
MHSEESLKRRVPRIANCTHLQEVAHILMVPLEIAVGNWHRATSELYAVRMNLRYPQPSLSSLPCIHIQLSWSITVESITFRTSTVSSTCTKRHSKRIKVSESETSSAPNNKPCTAYQFLNDRGSSLARGPSKQFCRPKAVLTGQNRLDRSVFLTFLRSTPASTTLHCEACRRVSMTVYSVCVYQRR